MQDVAVGIGIIFVIFIIVVATSKAKRSTKSSISNQQQADIEQITVIQPIVQDDFKK